VVPFRALSPRRTITQAYRLWYLTAYTCCPCSGDSPRLELEIATGPSGGYRLAGDFSHPSISAGLAKPDATQGAASAHTG